MPSPARRALVATLVPLVLLAGPVAAASPGAGARSGTPAVVELRDDIRRDLPARVDTSRDRHRFAVVGGALVALGALLVAARLLTGPPPPP
ncbi:MAG: hypothetical protein ACLGIR_07720 [Actinomycetes bacterium]